jgi:hypothetical protein
MTSRWLFIFDGIISFPIAIWGYYALPDQPRDTRAKWLKSSVRAALKWLQVSYLANAVI